MKMTILQKRLLIIGGIIVGVIIVAVFIVNQYMASIIRGKIDAALNENKTGYKVTLDKVGGNILFGNIRLKGLTITPDSSMLEDLKKGTAAAAFVPSADIPLFRIVGLDVYSAIVHGEIDLKRIEFKSASITLYKGKNPDKSKKEAGDQQAFNPDSIFIKGLNGIYLGEIDFIHCKLDVIDGTSDKKLFSTGNMNLTLSMIDVLKYKDQPNVFKLDLSKFKMEINSDGILLPGGWYNLSLKSLLYDRAAKIMEINGLGLHPTYHDKYKMAKALKYTKEMFDLDVDEIYIRSFDIKLLTENNSILIDSIGISGLNLKMLKDKRFPFDKTLRPKLPNQTLKSMKMPLYIRTVNIINGNLVYQEKMPDVKELMTASLGKLNVSIRFITSIRDSLRTGKPMKIALRANLMKRAPFAIDFVMPLNKTVDTFYFAGSLGAAKMKVFNQAAFPAIGIKFIKGRLNKLTFKGSANDRVSTGQMTLLYKDLEATVVKKDKVSKSKFLSWAANSFMRKSNPGKNGKTRVVQMGYDRDMYKGFGNFMWKTLMIGLVNTISPAGKSVKKEEKASKSSKRTKPNKKQSQKKQKKKKK